MKIEDLSSWQFDTPLSDGCSIRCPECKKYSKHTEWTYCEVYCDSCGEHSAIQCPKCLQAQDHVYAPVLKVRMEKTSANPSDVKQ